MCVQSISGCLSHEGKLDGKLYVIGYGNFDLSIWFLVLRSWDKQPEIDCSQKSTKCSSSCTTTEMMMD